MWLVLRDTGSRWWFKLLVRMFTFDICLVDGKKRVWVHTSCVLVLTSPVVFFCVAILQHTQSVRAQ